MDRPHRVNVSLTLWLCLAVTVSFTFLFILSNWAVEPFSYAELGSEKRICRKMLSLIVRQLGIVQQIRVVQACLAQNLVALRRIVALEWRQALLMVLSHRKHEEI